MWELAVCLGYGNGFYALRVEFCYLYHDSHTRPSMFSLSLARALGLSGGRSFVLLLAAKCVIKMFFFCLLWVETVPSVAKSRVEFTA